MKQVCAAWSAALISFAVGSCSSSKSDSSTSTACASSSTEISGGYALCLGSATSATIELAGGSSQSYIVAPFTLGNHSSVKAAGASTLSFSVAATSASLQQFNPPALQLNDDSDHDAMRLVLNRFDRRRGLNQEPWIWQTLKQLDAQHRQLTSESLETQYRAMATSPQEPNRVNQLTLATCPTSVPKVNSVSSSISISSSYEGSGFCIAYASSPVSDTKANIQSSVAAMVSAYKDTIYGDQFTANTASGYSFSPVIVVVDPTDNSMWPAGNSSYQFVGAFSKDATTAASRPIIYLMDDMTEVQSGISTAKAARLMHSTLAHEMQHAIMDYYKTRGTTTVDETVAIDEGIAHVFEDAFGYGEDNFSGYVSSFLSSVPDGTAILDGVNYNSAAARGGANAFIYFLAHRAGGFIVTSGRPFSGAGMTALTSLVKQTSSSGPTALASAFGLTTLTERMGEFIGALYSDNKSLSFAPTKFASASYDSISDLQGNTDRKFGLRFNNFRDFTTIQSNTLSDATGGIDLKHYATFPFVVTPTSTTAKVTLTFPSSENSGVSVIRIQ